MPVAANFVVVVDSDPIEDVAAEGGPLERDFDFQMPSDYAGSSRDRAILQFMTHPSREPEGQFQFQFRINGHIVYRYGPSTADFVRCFHVVFGGAALNAGANTMTVRRLDGEGTLGVSSAV